jgi:hypothetical protein
MASRRAYGDALLKHASRRSAFDHDAARSSAARQPTEWLASIDVDPAQRRIELDTVGRGDAIVSAWDAALSGWRRFSRTS